MLVTRFLSPNGVGELQDFMPILGRSAGNENSRIIRRVRVSRGEMEFRITCEPAFDYARAKHDTVTCRARQCIFRSERLTLALSSPLPLKSDRRGAHATFRLQEGESAVFVLRQIRDDEQCLKAPDESESQELFEQTVEYWRRWLSQCQYVGRWRDIVHRAALTLKLLTFEPTGALVAAATCSLPEKIGGPRNWDYRYTWIRDAAFSLYGLLRLGFTSEAADFMGWLDARYREQQGDSMPLGVLYGIDGRSDIPETTLDHLDGYRGSRPVRIGNAASKQIQLDIFGELFDSVYLFNKYGCAHFLRRVEASAFAAGLALEELAASRRRHLGSPRRPTRFRLFPFDVLGCLRSGPAIGRQAFVPGRSQRLAQGSRRDLRGDSHARLVRGAAIVRAVVRQPISRCIGPDHAARVLHGPQRSQDAQDDRRHQQAALPSAG